MRACSGMVTKFCEVGGSKFSSTVLCLVFSNILIPIHGVPTSIKFSGLTYSPKFRKTCFI